MRYHSTWSPNLPNTSTSPEGIGPLMYWTTPTRIPWWSARTTMPKAAVLLPFPAPVNTMTSPFARVAWARRRSKTSLTRCMRRRYSSGVLTVPPPPRRGPRLCTSRAGRGGARPRPRRGAGGDRGRDVPQGRDDGPLGRPRGPLHREGGGGSRAARPAEVRYDAGERPGRHVDHHRRLRRRLARSVAREDEDRGGEAPVGQGHARVGRSPQGGRHTGDDLEGDPRLREGQGLLSPAPEEERIPALEADDAAAPPRLVDHADDHLLVADGGAAALPAHVHADAGPLRPPQDGGVHEPVVVDHVRALDPLLAAHRHQVRPARTRPDEHHARFPHGATPRAAGGPGGLPALPA